MDTFWWAFLTITTVGYGGVVSRLTLGRIVGLILMLSRGVLVSLFTATVAPHRKVAEFLASRVRQSSQDVVRLTTALSIAVSS